MSEAVTLVCHSNKNIEDYLIVGKEYEADINWYDEKYEITNENNSTHAFLFDNDEFGCSYKNWFYIKRKEAPTYSYNAETGDTVTITTVEEAKRIIRATAKVRMHDYKSLNEDIQLSHVAKVFGLDLRTVRVTESESHYDFPYDYEFIEPIKSTVVDGEVYLSKDEILSRLNQGIEDAKGRQKPNATKDSGCMRGLKKAIEIIEGRL